MLMSSGGQEGQRHSAPSLHILLGPGLLATLPDWVSRVKTRSGTERWTQITPIDHLLPLHFSESPGHTPTKSKPCHHVHRAAQTGQPTETTAALFSWSSIPNRTSPCSAAATTHSHRPCDCTGRVTRETARKACADKSSTLRKGPAVTFLYSEHEGYYLRSLISFGLTQKYNNFVQLRG